MTKAKLAKVSHLPYMRHSFPFFSITELLSTVVRSSRISVRCPPRYFDTMGIFVFFLLEQFPRHPRLIPMLRLPHGSGWGKKKKKHVFPRNERTWSRTSLSQCFSWIRPWSSNIGRLVSPSHTMLRQRFVQCQNCINGQRLFHSRDVYFPAASPPHHGDRHFTRPHPQPQRQSWARPLNMVHPPRTHLVPRRLLLY